MELFATDRERLAFLLETDAVLDLEFEVLEAQAEAAAEEPCPQQQPQHITNYVGSKQNLVDWIWKHTPRSQILASDVSFQHRIWMLRWRSGEALPEQTTGVGEWGMVCVRSRVSVGGSRHG